MRRHRVSHGRDGFTYRIKEAPAWAVAVAEGTERLLVLLGHPCCWKGAGRIPPIGWASNRLLNLAGNVEHLCSRSVLDLPLTEEQARALGWTDPWWWADDEDDDEDDVAEA